MYHLYYKCLPQIEIIVGVWRIWAVSPQVYRAMYHCWSVAPYAEFTSSKADV